MSFKLVPSLVGRLSLVWTHPPVTLHHLDFHIQSKFEPYIIFIFSLFWSLPLLFLVWGMQITNFIGTSEFKKIFKIASKSNIDYLSFQLLVKALCNCFFLSLAPLYSGQWRNLSNSGIWSKQVSVICCSKWNDSYFFGNFVMNFRPHPCIIL